MTLRLLRPDERPALAAGQPLVWNCPKGREAGRAGLRQQARLLLAELLSHYLGQPAQGLGLVFEAGQPPRLAASWQGLRLSLGISYCGELAAVGLCPGVGIGIDLATVTPLPDWREVARLYLGPTVESRLACLPAAERDRQFAQVWASQEARLKSLGLPLQEWTAALQQRLDEGVARVETVALANGALMLALACASSQALSGDVRARHAHGRGRPPLAWPPARPRP